MRLIRLAPLALAASAAATAVAQDRSAAPPTGLVVPVYSDDALEVVDDRGDRRTRSRSRTVERNEDEPPRAWNEIRAPRGPRVIEERTGTPTTIRAGETDPDRLGMPLGAGIVGREGVGRTRNDGPITFRANDAVAEPAQPARRRDADEPRAPIGLTVPVGEWDSAPMETTGSIVPRSMAPRSFMGEEPDAPVIRMNPPGAPKSFLDNGTGASIRVEEVKTERDDDTFLRLGAGGRVEPVPARRAVRGTPAPAVVPAKTEAPKVLGYDPFEKLDQELESIGEAPRSRPQPEPRREEFRVDPLAARTLRDEDSRAPVRDPAFMGLAATAGVGLAISTEARGGFVPSLAYGGQVSYSPPWAGAFGLELGFWRTGKSDGTPFVNVDSSQNHVTLRATYLHPLPKGAFAGGGAGLLVTMSTARYQVVDGAPAEAFASTVRPGVDATAIFGYRLRPFEARVDLRAFVRGGMRLDMMPSLSIGAAF